MIPDALVILLFGFLSIISYIFFREVEE